MQVVGGVLGAVGSSFTASASQDCRALGATAASQLPWAPLGTPEEPIPHNPFLQARAKRNEIRAPVHHAPPVFFSGPLEFCHRSIANPNHKFLALTFSGAGPRLVW